MTKKFFVTGTDTEVGKTFITCALLHKAKSLGFSTGALKPVAAGCELIDGQWRNQDAVNLQQAMTLQLPYEVINPIALERPIAPHVAAAMAGQTLQVSQLVKFIEQAFVHNPELWLIEGAGGWLVPLNESETLADLALALHLPVILVVGMKLGCINHALLTHAKIEQMGLHLAGWVANSVVGPYEAMADNVATLETLLPAPLLGVVPNRAPPSVVIDHLDLSPLMAK